MTAAAPIHGSPVADTDLGLGEDEWRSLEAAHRERVAVWTGPHRRRAARGERHPVFDFLFEYYKRRASHLERWNPGLGRALEGAGAGCFLRRPGYARRADGAVAADPRRLAAHRVDSIRWIQVLLRACAERPPFFGCSGMHEWAMVHRTEAVRHPSTPLRLPPDEIARLVEATGVRCSHFDAFRFFTGAARPLNRLQPTRDSRLGLEQRGCVHVTMDLYKWAYKLEPFAPGELVADAFALALEARTLDMRASPYDLRALGFAPVRVETPEGRADYEAEQRALAERAAPLRARLLGVCGAVLTALRGVGDPDVPSP